MLAWCVNRQLLTCWTYELCKATICQTCVTFPSRASVCKPASICRWRLSLHREPSGIPEEPASVPADETDHPTEPGPPTSPAAAAGPRQPTAAAGTTPAHLPKLHWASVRFYISSVFLLAGYFLNKLVNRALRHVRPWAREKCFFCGSRFRCRSGISLKRLRTACFLLLVWFVLLYPPIHWARIRHDCSTLLNIGFDSTQQFANFLLCWMDLAHHGNNNNSTSRWSPVFIPVFYWTHWEIWVCDK